MHKFHSHALNSEHIFFERIGMIENHILKPKLRALTNSIAESRAIKKVTEVFLTTWSAPVE